LRTWVNLSSGTIEGIELQAVARPADHWSLSWGGHVIDGEDDDGVTLADTPPNELYLGATRHAGPWTTEARLRLRDDRSDPGPGELPISSAQLLAASVRYRWSSGWEMGFGGTNLLDEDYLPSADDKAVPGAGRAFTAHVTRRR
jgi:outer membrane receptor protein involved in Fe transport